MGVDPSCVKQRSDGGNVGGVAGRIPLMHGERQHVSEKAEKSKNMNQREAACACA